MHREPPLWQRLYQDEVYYETARIIGYEGIAPFDFWDAAKPLTEKHGKDRVECRERRPPTHPVRQARGESAALRVDRPRADVLLSAPRSRSGASGVRAVLSRRQARAETRGARTEAETSAESEVIYTGSGSPPRTSRGGFRLHQTCTKPL